jgi:DNA mismatch repair protein MutS
VEHYVEAGAFVPNDTELATDGQRLMIITGPNMAGKSTLMRQVTLCTIMAQMGSFVPARSARIGLVDRILSRVGASDNLVAGESTFMVEMRETATILRDATKRSLVIVDEVGRGTSTFDGLALAWAVAEHLHDAVGCRTMFATHYHQLTELADGRDGIVNYCVSARQHEGEIVFLHRLTKGSVSKSYGIAVARLAGLPESTLGRAGAILSSLETGREVTGGPQLERHGADAGQLDLFTPPRAVTSEQTVCQTLRHTDPNRLTPLEALALVAKLKARLADGDGAAEATSQADEPHDE